MVRGDRSERRKIRGTAESVVQARHKLSRSPNGVAAPVVAPSQEAIRQAIESGICPWCGRGPYKMLAGHVNGQHGIDRFELRELAGLTRHASICDPAFAAERSDLARSRSATPPVQKPGRKRTYSTAGKERQRANGARVHASLSPEAKEAMRQGSRKAGAVRGAQLRKERQPCVVCGGPIAFSPGYTERKTCSRTCLVQLKAATMSRLRSGITSCKSGHPFDEVNTIIRPNGNRACRECMRAAGRKYQERKRREGGRSDA